MRFAPPQTLEEALSAIVDSEDFIVVDKGAYTVINYVLASNDTFPPVTDQKSAWRRELRGIIYDNATRGLIRLPPQKFFNYGERTETLPENIDLSDPHIILDKIDGSLIAPFKTFDGILRWGSKLGETEFSEQFLMPFIHSHPDYIRFAAGLIAAGYTPSFELTHPEARIVIDYGSEPNLTLLAIREMVSGEYVNHLDVTTLGNMHGIPVVRELKGDFKSVGDFVNWVSTQEGIEGFVYRREDGFSFKCKTETYVNLHKVKEAVSNERAVVGLIIDEKLDDLKGLLPQGDLDRLKVFEEKFLKHIRKLVCKIDEVIGFNVQLGTSRKDFAIKEVPNLPKAVSNIVFKNWDRQEELTKIHVGVSVFLSDLKDLIRKGLSNNSAYDKLKENLEFKEVY